METQQAHSATMSKSATATRHTCTDGSEHDPINHHRRHYRRHIIRGRAGRGSSARGWDVSDKQYLKMADVFQGKVSTKLIDRECIGEMTKGDSAWNHYTLQDDAYWMLTEQEMAEYAANAINSHDELVRQRDELLAAIADHDRLVSELDALINGEAGAAKQASLCDIVAQLRHSPDAGKMVTGGYVIVGRAEISMVISALNRDAEDGMPVRKEMADELIHSMERAMLAAAPKLDEKSVNERLGKALDMVMAASPALMSNEFEFHGEEISGPKPGGK